MYVFSSEFILISDRLESQSKDLQKFVRSVGLDVPVYFLPSLTSTDGRHIDCDFQAIDPLKLIYGSHNVFQNVGDEKYRFSKGRRMIEEIARKQSFDFREYGLYEDEQEPIDIESDDFYYDSFKRLHGINFIVDNALLTGAIHPEERSYLQGKGMEVVKVPLGKLTPGAGLRCIYGEFNL